MTIGTTLVQHQRLLLCFTSFDPRILGWWRSASHARTDAPERPQTSQTDLSSVLRLIGSVALALGALTGCQAVGSFAGWAVAGRPSLAPTRPACHIDAGKAKVCRTDSNALQIAISPLRRSGSLESWTADQYQVHLTFTTNSEEDFGQASLQFPLFQVDGISDVRLLSDKAQKKIVVSFLANSLGLDLLGAAFSSPRGLAGVFIFANQTRFLEAEAQIFATGDAVALVWLSKTKNHLYVQSKIEANQILEFSLGKDAPKAIEIGPFQEKWIRLCDSCEIVPEEIKLRVFSGRRVPVFPFDIYLNGESK